MSRRDATDAELPIFVVTPSSNLTGPPADLSDINGVSCRKRKRHTKSHSGCVACKRRRVKVCARMPTPGAMKADGTTQCDNARPNCRTCVRRRETCSLASSPLPYKDSTSPIPCHGFSNGLNDLQMTLFDHFAKNTASTLPFGGSLWRNEVISLALQVISLVICLPHLCS